MKVARTFWKGTERRTSTRNIGQWNKMLLKQFFIAHRKKEISSKAKWTVGKHPKIKLNNFISLFWVCQVGRAKIKSSRSLRKAVKRPSNSARECRSENIFSELALLANTKRLKTCARWNQMLIEFKYLKNQNFQLKFPFLRLTNFSIDYRLSLSCANDQQPRTQIPRISWWTHGEKSVSASHSQHKSSFASFSHCISFVFSSLAKWKIFRSWLWWKRRMTTIVVEVYEAINNVLRNQGKVAQWKYHFSPCVSCKLRVPLSVRICFFFREAFCLAAILQRTHGGVKKLFSCEERMS